MKLVLTMSLLSMTLNASAATVSGSKIKTSQAAPIAAQESTQSVDNAGVLPAGAEIKPIIGYAFVNPKELNAEHADWANKMKVNDSYKIGGAAFYGAQAQYYFESGFGAGLRFDYLSTSTNSVNYTPKDANGKVIDEKNRATLQSGLTIAPLYALLSYRKEVAPKITLGGTAGAGYPIAFNYYTKVTGSTIDAIKNGERSYSANPFTWMISASSAYQLTETFGVQIEAGYRYLVSSQFKADERFGDEIKEGDLLQTADKSNQKVDASAFNGSVGITIAL